MPYYRHAKTDTAAAVGEPYHNKQCAMDGIPADETATFMASHEEIAAWHERECVRLNDGTYQPVPALPPLPERLPALAASETTAHHYLHLSDGNPGLVAYTPSDEFGVEDRQLRCKPGKYLQKFYGEVFTAQQIVVWADTVKAAGVSMHFTATPEQCVRVYRSLRGPDSCMGNPTRWSADAHPAQVYGGGDVSVAYLGHIGGEQTANDSVTARAVVNTRTKKYATVYGTAAGELRVLLSAAGYTTDRAALEGARILSRPRPSGGGYFIPYIDGMNKAVIGGAFDTAEAAGAAENFLIVTNSETNLAWLSVNNLEGWGVLNAAT